MWECPRCGENNPLDVELCKGCGAKRPAAAKRPLAGEPGGREDSGDADVQPAWLEQQLREQLRQGRKIAAIKLYRQQTGVGLKQAKDAVEALARGHQTEPSKCGGCASALLLACGLAIGIVLAGALSFRLCG